ncbi:hypothetical protein LCI18_001674 [Fusarium solani-melongenae]|uniref:Uncharacterized protein n=1 Tax=Fusarium solani subsp. cucurbitae TaxID=2747967 RepID=A0ACD3YP30_FUSSC|nr:hypothetical protein LCI18_001674 [Fusarium solani-melongenae]
MGTGITSILLYTLPYNAGWLRHVATAIFCLNIIYFLVFLLIAALRYILYPEIFGVMLRHPAQSMFLGTLPMGMATLVNMFCFVCVPAWGDAAAYFAFAIWVVDAILSIVIALGVPFVFMTRPQPAELASMTAGWLLPIVSCVVAAASGGIVAEILPHPYLALGTILASYVLWGIGVPLALMVIVIYLQRLMLHKLPPKAVILSVFLPLGPLGQGGFGIQKLGAVSKTIFPETSSLDARAGDILYTLGFLVGLVMWAFGIVWVSFALASLVRTRRFPFNLSWWGLTFPLGVYATCTCQLGKELPSTFFDVVGTIFSLIVLIMWLLVSAFTYRGIYRGDIFVAPCLKDLGQSSPRQQNA